MTALADSIDACAVVIADAEAIEHAMHRRLLRNLGLRTDAEIQAAIAEVRSEAEERSLSVAQLAAADYDDNPKASCRRMRSALWRSCQIHHAEDQWPALSGVPAEPNGGLK